MTKTFGIFEGGGAKGLAHIGALKSAEDHNIDFIGVAGASAGAIVASLVAAGYKADELFNHDRISNELYNTSTNSNNSNTKQEQSIFEVDFINLLGKKRWRLISLFRKILKFCNSHKIIRVISLLFIATIFILFVCGLLFTIAYFVIWSWVIAVLSIFFLSFISFIFICLTNIFLPHGFFTTTKFEKWLNEKLSKKIFGENSPIKEVKFSDIQLPLKIIATDIKSRKPIVFSKETYPDYSVAKAVCYSISIPGAFRPHSEGDMVLVDGGVLSNFPAWVFDQQRKDEKEIISTIGFRLNSLKEERSKKRNSMSRYFLDLSTVFFGDNLLQIREIEDLHLIPINVSANTLDFDMGTDDKLKLYKEGKHEAENFFKQFTGRKNITTINFYLETLYKEMIRLINRPNIHLRVNLSLPVEPLKQKLRILYSYNMDNDADDRLELNLNSGAIGRCWNTGNPVLVNMLQAKKTFETEWRMSKYKQALVRPSLKTLVSIPIFDTESLDTPNKQVKNKILAVLSIDSDDNLLGEFTALSGNVNSSMEELVSSFSKRISEELRR